MRDEDERKRGRQGGCDGCRAQSGGASGAGHSIPLRRITKDLSTKVQIIEYAVKTPDTPGRRAVCVITTAKSRLAFYVPAI
jgi:hypothetical protein